MPSTTWLFGISNQGLVVPIPMIPASQRSVLKPKSPIAVKLKREKGSLVDVDKPCKTVIGWGVLEQSPK